MTNVYSSLAYDLHAVRRLGVTLVVVVIAAMLLLTVTDVACAEDLGSPEIKEADAAVLMDKGGNILFDLNGEKREHPASITKVMSAMVALDSGHKLDETVEITAPDLGENSQMGDYSTGDRVTLNELLQVMLVYSGNDAAWNVACYVAGDEPAFVDLMNKKAAEIGMTHTHFANSHGLEDDNHYTCAYDLALMGRYALEHYPYIAQTALQHDVYANIYGDVQVLHSTDRLLDTFNGIRGIKTGAIVDNYTFLGASGRGNTQLYTAVLGCATFMGRFDDAASIMEWGYANYRDVTLTKGGWVVGAKPLADDMGYKAVIESATDFTGRAWPNLSSYGYKSVLPRVSNLLDVRQRYGWTAWNQSNADMGSVEYTTRETPARVSAWPVFELPLFENTATLGKAASNAS